MGTVQVAALCYTCKNYYQCDNECACDNFLEYDKFVIECDDYEEGETRTSLMDELLEEE